MVRRILYIKEKIFLCILLPIPIYFYCAFHNFWYYFCRTQGERKGQENLKTDLVRRIKMLEYALKQERAKYAKVGRLLVAIESGS